MKLWRVGDCRREQSCTVDEAYLNGNADGAHSYQPIIAITTPRAG